MNARELRQLQQLRQQKLGSYIKQDLSHLWCVRVSIRLLSMYSSNLCGADFREAVLRGAHLGRTNLLYTDFRGANLTDASLRNANFRNTDLRGADLRGADLTGEVDYER